MIISQSLWDLSSSQGYGPMQIPLETVCFLSSFRWIGRTQFLWAISRELSPPQACGWGPACIPCREAGP